LGTSLKQVMKNLFIECHKEIFLKLTEKEIKKSSSFIFIPEFDKNRIQNGFKKKKIINYKKIVYNYKKNIFGLSSYKIATSILKTTIRKKTKSFDEQLVVDFESVVRKLILDFLTYNLSHLNLKKSDLKIFDVFYPKFASYLKNELFTVFCFTTLRNFDSVNSSYSLPNDQIFRLRTSEEFSTICDIKDMKIMPRIKPNFQKIKYIIGTNISKTSISDQKIRERFEKFLFSLKIFHGGDVQFGGIYYRESLDWEVKPTICIAPEPILNRPRIKYRLETESYSKKDFNKFIKDFYQINLTKGKYVFLGRSIKRFSQAKYLAQCFQIVMT